MGDRTDIKLRAGLLASVIDEKEHLGECWQEWLEYSRPIRERTGVVHYKDDWASLGGAYPAPHFLSPNVPGNPRVVRLSERTVG